MSSWRSEPFLWIHLAGIALLPVFLGIVWLGLTVGTPTTGFLWEFILVAVVGIVPILWMQLTRPFDIFSILLFALKPECLSTQQRQILALFKTNKQKWLSIVAAMGMLAILWLLYNQASSPTGLVSFLPQWRGLGLAIAIIAFSSSNLFLQVPLSVLGVLFSNTTIVTETTEPYPMEKITQDFSVLGLKVERIFSFWQPE